MGTKTPLVNHKTQLSEYAKVNTVGYRQYSKGKPRGKAGKVRILSDHAKALVIEQLRKEGRLVLRPKGEI